MSLKIHKTTDPILRAECEPVTDFGVDFQKFIDDMIETMHKKNGIGLAAPQVGVAKKVFICQFEGEKSTTENRKGIPEIPLTVMCNPKITWLAEDQVLMVEGCLSFPGMERVVNRPKEAIIKGQDRHGNNIELKVDGLFARVIQHEYDHLNSTLLIDKGEKHQIVFIGTGSLGIKALEALNRDPQYEILLVITGEEKAITGRKVAENPIFEIAEHHKLPILKTANIKDPEVIERVKKLNPDLGIMADFGQIIPKEMLDIFKYGLLNIHPSLLPLYRGPSPVQYTILNGDKFAGVTIMLTSAKMDAGPTITQGKVELYGNETTTILKDYLGQYGANLLMNAIPYYITGDLPPVAQEEERAIFSHIIKKVDGYVETSTPAVEVDRKIRAFDNWPKAWTKINDKRVLLISGHFEEDGLYLLDLVKPEGKKIMNYSDFINGYKTEISFK